MHHKRGKPKSSRMSCMCKYWKHPAFADGKRPELMGVRNFRLTQDSLDSLAQEETLAQLQREVSAGACDDWNCDCGSAEDDHKLLEEVLFGDLMVDLTRIGVTLTLDPQNPLSVSLTTDPWDDIHTE